MTVRRRNFHGIRLKAGAAIMYPQLFTGLHDLSMGHVDTWTKTTYPLVENLAHDFNFSLDVTIVNEYGWEHNGTFAGLLGLLERTEVDISASAFSIRKDRMRVVDYSAETFTVNTAVIFRQPTLSSISNIFILPFSQAVWISCSLLCLITLGIIGFQMFTNKKRGVEKNMMNVTCLDIATFVLGAICQQGSYVTPSSLSPRVTMFVLSLASLFLFTSYSANIVALLQSPSHAIKTVSDLITSPITVGLQDLIFHKIYLEESTDPETQHFYLRKVVPLGDKIFKNVSEGMARVREGTFGFQVDKVAGYKEISETYTEREKCGLKEIQLFALPPLTVATRKHSGYREIFAQRLRWQREVGILKRMARLWLPLKPVCENKMSGFLSVGIIDFYPALLVLQYGLAASVGILFAELLYFHRCWFLTKLFLNKDLGHSKLSNVSKKSDKNGTTLAWIP